MTDTVWSSLPDTPRRAFGSALNPSTDGRICHPPLVTEPTRKISNKRLRRMMEEGK